MELKYPFGMKINSIMGPIPAESDVGMHYLKIWNIDIEFNGF